jgi:hypothetical protein
MYNVVFKTIGYWRFYWGSWNGFQNAVGEISVHIYGLTVLAKALKPLPVVKQMLTVKRTMHLQMRNKGTVVVTWI